MTTPAIPLWGCFEAALASHTAYANACQDVAVRVTFTAPSGRAHAVDAFWDGGATWRVRFAPDEIGAWTYTTTATDTGNAGLHGQSGDFQVGPPHGASRFAQYGPIRVSDNRRYLVHADGTPFLWLGDTAWNGPLMATDAEWQHYVDTRVAQGFTAVQWVATHWRVAPHGDREGHMAYTGVERIEVNPAFFQRLDGYVRAMTDAGLLSVPVMLWSHTGGSEETARFTPGNVLPDDQAILLARYMAARWGAYPTAWILPGDGDYRGERAARWQRIGRGVFAGEEHAPVSLHPQGMHWNGDEFRHEAWLDILGYQSGHGDDDRTFAWLLEGPPATDWQTDPPRVLINLEPPYEDHIAYQSRQRISDRVTRRALYWSLLVSPPAGVTYGGHGVWGWDDGTTAPADHPGTGVPKPWREALHLPAAEDVAHLASLFDSLAWWTLRPAPAMVVDQPGAAEKARFVTAARSAAGDLAVVYIPADRAVTLDLSGLTPGLTATWFNPRDGTHQPALVKGGEKTTVTTPDTGDWVLILLREITLTS